MCSIFDFIFSIWFCCMTTQHSMYNLPWCSTIRGPYSPTIDSRKSFIYNTYTYSFISNSLLVYVIYVFCLSLLYGMRRIYKKVPHPMETYYLLQLFFYDGHFTVLVIVVILLSCVYFIRVFTIRNHPIFNGLVQNINNRKFIRQKS
jgi:MFS superfamily sulfate permease-like transporter